MSKHTPGPWAVGNVDPLSFGQPQGNGMLPLGFVYGPSHAELSEHGRECLANAQLCAAAPDLLEALQDAAVYLSLYGETADHAREKALAAISKATGVSNE